MSNNYVVQNKLIVRKRAKNYDQQDSIKTKWEYVDAPENEIGIMYALTVTWDSEKRWEWGKLPNDKSTSKHIFDVIPSSEMLYKIACIFGRVSFYENPYKFLWYSRLHHKESQEILYIGDTKGGVAIGCSKYYKDKNFPRSDIEELLSFLCSYNVLHPYDGVIAGSVA
jgi:hypothetical protein